MIVDAHCHLTPELPEADLIQAMDEAGVAKVALHAPAVEAFPGRPTIRAGVPALPEGLLTSALSPLGRAIYNLRFRGGRVRVHGRSYGLLRPADNEAVAQALQAHPDRFIGFAVVDPGAPGFVEGVDGYVSRGFRGVKVEACLGNVDVAGVLRGLARRLGELGLPLMVHLGGVYHSGLAILDLADRYPTTNFIIAHAGLPYFRPLWKASRSRPNLYFDLAGPYVSADLVALAASRVAPGRLLFASGGPWGLRLEDGRHGYAAPRQWVERLPLGREAVRAVMGGNFLRLVGLGRQSRVA